MACPKRGHASTLMGVRGHATSIVLVFPRWAREDVVMFRGMADAHTKAFFRRTNAVASRFIRSRFLVAAALCACAARGTADHRNCAFESTIGNHVVTCPWIGPANYLVTSINSGGLAVGHRVNCDLNNRVPSIWWAYQSDDVVDLDLPWPYVTAECVDVNDDGVILGKVDLDDNYPSNDRAFFYDTRTREFTLLVPPPLPDPIRTKFRPYALNRSLQWCGALEFYDGEQWHMKPFRAQGMEFEWLYVSGTDCLIESGEALSISETGAASGWVYVGKEYVITAARWAAQGERALLAPLSGDGSAKAIRINSSNLTLVWSQGPTMNERHAVLWYPSGATKLVASPAGSIDLNNIKDLNDAGEVLASGGVPFTESNGSSWIWRDGESWLMGDIADPPDGESVFSTAVALNNSGDIVTDADSGRLAYFRRSPSSQHGDFNRDCRIETEDLLSLLTRWSTDDFEHDLDRSGLVGLGDLVILLDNWYLGTWTPGG